MNLPILSVIIFLPAVGALINTGFALHARRRKRPYSPDLYYAVAQFFTALTFGFAFPLFFLYTPGLAVPQFVESAAWIPAWGIRYNVGLDDLNLLLFLLAAFLTPLACWAAKTEIRERAAGFYILLPALETPLLGVFAARDMFLFYLFWELTLVPMFFIILLWGGPRRVYAAVKFFLYTFLGSLFMLVGILGLYIRVGGGSFSWDRTLQALHAPGILGFHEEIGLFLAFAVAFLVKVPAVPLHTWLPAAHVEAPTPGSVLLAGLLLKMGAYGLLRFCIPLFPAARAFFQWPMVMLGVVGIVYGSWAALAQRDMKRLVAYSSVAHMGIVLVGLFALTPQAMQGAVLQMVNHGLGTGALFMLVGVLYRRTHTRDLDAFGGLARGMPVYAAVFLIVALSSIGLPGTNGFVGEFLVLWGAFERYPRTALVALTAVIWSAIYMLRMIRKVFHGPRPEGSGGDPPDLTRFELGSFVPVIILIFLIGLWPGPFLARASRILKFVGGALAGGGS